MFLPPLQGINTHRLLLGSQGFLQVNGEGVAPLSPPTAAQNTSQNAAPGGKGTPPRNNTGMSWQSTAQGGDWIQQGMSGEILCGVIAPMSNHVS